MRWLLTGALGMLGTDARILLEERGYRVSALGRSDLDITDEDAVAAAVADHDVVFNCAAWTAVDDAEDDEDAAFAVNAVGPRLLARATAGHGARLVQVSTDYVFSGSAASPYAESDPVQPVSAYGRSKAAGEKAVRDALPDAHLIVRGAWLYGAHGRCFPKTIARLARERGRAEVVDDQVGQPTWTRDVAELVVRLVEAAAPAGTYHATASGQTSWFEFAQEVVAAAGFDRSVVQPVTSDRFPRPAPRPSYSVLGHAALQELGVAPIGDWRQRWLVAADQVLAEQ